MLTTAYIIISMMTANNSNCEGKYLKGLIVFFFKLIGIPLGIIFYSV